MNEMTSIDGVGPSVVEALGNFFHEPHNVAVWDDLLEEVSPPPYVVETTASAPSRIAGAGRLASLWHALR